MKRTLLTLTVAFATGMTNINAQNVTIPDANFKAYLVGESSINTNLDSEIQVSEAASYTGGIYATFLNISDLTGIEAFTSITLLGCSYNQLTSLDISANVALTTLSCNNNQLVNLDVSSNTALTVLNCNDNQLVGLNLSSNTALVSLSCYANQLTGLNVSANTALYHLTCNDNQLTSMNIANGNNSNITYLDITNNPNLTCIQVDDAAFMNTNWASSKDATASYSEDCSGTTSINDISIVNQFSVYPNPTKNQINFSVQTNVQLTSVTGQIIADRKNVNTLDLSDQPEGIYFLTHTDNNGRVIQRNKIVKE